MAHPRHPSRSGAPVRRLAAVAVGLALILSACGGSGPGGATAGPAPTKAELRSAASEATRVVEGFYHLVARNDARACKLLDAAAAEQLKRATDAETCAQAVRVAATQGGKANRKRLAALTFDEHHATSRLRVEVNHADREDDQPVVAEYVGTRWVITSLG